MFHVKLYCSKNKNKKIRLKMHNVSYETFDSIFIYCYVSHETGLIILKCST